MATGGKPRLEMSDGYESTANLESPGELLDKLSTLRYVLGRELCRLRVAGLAGIGPGGITVWLDATVTSPVRPVQRILERLGHSALHPV